MCTGQPLRLPAELEAAANRLYFPLVGQDRPPHTLIFADAAGRTLTAQVPPGRYAPDTLCAHLEAAMNAAAAAAGSADLAFTVTHEDDPLRLRVRAPRRRPRRPRPLQPALPPPALFRPRAPRLRTATPRRSDTYLAAQQVHVPRGTDGRPLANVLRVSEVGPQKRFRFHAAGPPPMVGAVLGGAGGGSLAVRTHVNGQPYAHGYRAGDVVALAPSPGHEGVGTPTAATLPVELSCVVLAADPDPCVLHLAAPAIPGLRDAGTAVAVLGSLEPWNLCMCKPRSLPAPMLGFPPRAVQWGIDGSVGSAEQLLPPFDAPHVHCLDHPDCVLLTFSEGAGVGVEHSYAGETKHILAKICCYPLLREERALPRDTTLQRDQIGRFTLAFYNPDLRTPYRFHGAEFTFSLAFYSFLPD